MRLSILPGGEVFPGRTSTGELMPHLLREDNDGICILTLNRPEIRNAIDDEIMRLLAEETARLSADESLRAVVVTGAGSEAFCAGGDLKWLQSFENADAGEAMSRRMQKILARLANLPVPVICVLNGYALGGGTEIALSCDIQVMEKSTYLSFRHARIGLMPGWGGGARLLRLCGHARAMELLTTCRDLPAAKALEIGLTNAVVPGGTGLAEGVRIACEIARAAPLSVRAIKKLIIEAAEKPLAEAADLEASLFASLWDSEDHDEAVKAFFEKRAPGFRGR
jgi:enoyl-CoA hydratase